MSIITSDIISKIKELSKIKGGNIEKELDLNANKKDINYETYLNLIKYLHLLSKQNNFKLIKEETIDVGYSQANDKQLINNRISISSNIFDSCYTNFKSNSSKNIYLKLLFQLKRNVKGISIVRKVRNKDNVYDFKDYNIRFRCNQELPLSNKEINELINEVKQSKVFISFRMKKRISLFVDDIRIDLTNAIKSNKFDFENKPQTFELELEFNNITSSLDLYVKRLLKIIQQSNTLITLPEIKSINTKYNELFNKPLDNVNTRIDSMNVISLGIKDLDNLENKYAITDKADGEHSFLFVCNETIYLISQYFHIKNSGVKVNKKFNGTVIDGEAIFINNNYLFMCFDCLFYCGDDVRGINSLIDRMEFVRKFCFECFGFKSFDYLASDKVENINKVTKYYSDQLIKFNKDLTKELQTKKFIVRPKMFLKVYGLSNNEIFIYSKLFWNIYKSLSKTNEYPYFLDGLVYQPIDQNYTLKPRQQLFKWKPSYQNSIDFYLEFKRDEFGKIINVYDNVVDTVDNLSDTEDKDETNEDVDEKDEKVKTTAINKYRIAYLYVGHVNNGFEEPIKFSPKLNNPDNDIHIIYIPINDKGYCEDREHNVINDKTVVECYYDQSDKKYFKWKVIRTRYDKTENVMNYHRKYGNNDEVANGIWNCIKYPITFDDITDLASDNYVSAKDRLRDINPIKQTQYYTVDYEIRNAVDAKVNFHNLIKTQLINAYCGFKDGHKMSVFDPAIGKGKDINNYYNAHVKNVIGMDKDFAGLHNNNGTFQKYKTLREKKPGVPFMDFINGDFTVALNSENQINSGMDKSRYNVNAMNKYFKNKFDVISCHFAFHYFLENEERFNQTLANIDQLLNKNGYIILTLFDGQLVNEYIEKEGKDGVVENYIDIKGIRTLIHRITKKYDIKSNTTEKRNGELIFKCGNPIDVFVGEGGINMTEYLVDKTYLIEKFKEHKIELVETATFEEVYNNYRAYVNEVSLIETKEGMKRFLDRLKKYYEDNEVNKECFKITRLNRFYVFKKIAE